MTTAELRALGRRLDSLGDELMAAERENAVTAQIVILRERARAFHAYSTGAVLAAQRDEATAFALERGAE